MILPVVTLAVAFGAGTGARGQEPGWELSGRVLRADTGAPLAGAKVMYRGEDDVRDSNGKVVNSSTLQGEVTTGADGIYCIAGLPAGNYRVRAVVSGYLAAANTVSALPPVTTCQSCLPAPDSDLKLQPDVIHLSTMNTEAFLQAHGENLLFVNVVGIDSSFSPDGKLLAMALDLRGASGEQQEAWLYDLPSGQLKLLEFPAGSKFYWSGFVWQGDQLYMQAALTPSGGQTSQVFASASFDNPVVTVIPALPPAAQLAYAQTESEGGGNARYRAWAESSCVVQPDPHCGQGSVLAVENMSTRRRRIVGPIESQYLFDPERSVVIYVSGDVPPSGWQNGVTALDLPTGRKRLTALPSENLFGLMAEQRVADGYLIAYWTEGDCDSASTDSSQDFDLSGSLQPKVNVCFATIAAP